MQDFLHPIDVEPRLGAELHRGDVADVDHAALRVHLHHDVFELFLLGEPAGGVDDVLVGLFLLGGGLADLAGGNLDVLLADRCEHLLRGYVAALHQAWIQPDPHAVVGAAEDVEYVFEVCNCHYCSLYWMCG